MFGQRQIFSLVISLLGCLETKEGLDTAPDSDFFQADCETKAPSEPIAPSLSLETDTDSLEGGMPLTPMDPQAEWMCSLAANPLRFTVQEDDPAVFYLQPAREITYCVRVERTEGYITLQHEEGGVEREGNVFMWCFLRPWESQKGITARLRVLSLTPEAKIIVTLQRGEN